MESEVRARALRKGAIVLIQAEIDRVWSVFEEIEALQRIAELARIGLAESEVNHQDAPDGPPPSS